MLVARLSPNGRLDGGFGREGRIMTPLLAGADARAIAFDAQDRPVVVGSDLLNDLAVVRLAPGSVGGPGSGPPPPAGSGGGGPGAPGPGTAAAPAGTAAAADPAPAPPGVPNEPAAAGPTVALGGSPTVLSVRIDGSLARGAVLRHGLRVRLWAPRDGAAVVRLQMIVGRHRHTIATGRRTLRAGRATALRLVVDRAGARLLRGSARPRLQLTATANGESVVRRLRLA
jgi:hypothetical protein